MQKWPNGLRVSPCCSSGNHASLLSLCVYKQDLIRSVCFLWIKMLPHPSPGPIRRALYMEVCPAGSCLARDFNLDGSGAACYWVRPRPAMCLVTLRRQGPRRLVAGN